MVDVLDNAVGERKIDARRGTMDSRVSRQWFARPADQRYTTLYDLATAVDRRWRRSHEEVIPLSALRFREDEADPGQGLLASVGVAGDPLAPTNWAFGQLCGSLRLPSKDGKIGVPAAYIRALPTKLAAINLNAAAQMQQGEHGKLFVEQHNGRGELKAATSPSYGRISDASVACQLLDLTNRQSWKVPGVINWSQGTYDPYAPVTPESTTLFASDRDVWVFLVDDLHPIEVGKLANGDPDLMFRGFIVSNSEVGAKRLHVSTMYLRGVCCNRCLWGVERKASLDIRHTSRAPERFVAQALPALEHFTLSDPQRVVEGVRAAKAAQVAKDAEGQVKFLTGLGFSEKVAKGVIDIGRETEGDPLTAWDMAQALTRYAQGKEHADERYAVEQTAGEVLDAVKV